MKKMKGRRMICIIDFEKEFLEKMNEPIVEDNMEVEDDDENAEEDEAVERNVPAAPGGSDAED